MTQQEQRKLRKARDKDSCNKCSSLLRKCFGNRASFLPVGRSLFVNGEFLYLFASDCIFSFYCSIIHSLPVKFLKALHVNECVRMGVGGARQENGK